MRSLLLMLLILALLTTQGCYDAVDLNEQLFAVNLALDKGESAALRLTLQVILRSTATTTAGLPYTTACSPRMTNFPGADAVNHSPVITRSARISSSVP